jgi:hypothetical protein
MKNLHFDHDISFSKGGSGLTAANVRLLRAKCNLQNGADGISDIEGKIARVATRELGNERVSNRILTIAPWIFAGAAKARAD